MPVDRVGQPDVIVKTDLLVAKEQRLVGRHHADVGVGVGPGLAQVRFEVPAMAPGEAELDLYCDRVAGAVGRLSVRAFDADGSTRVVGMERHTVSRA